MPEAQPTTLAMTRARDRARTRTLEKAAKRTRAPRNRFVSDQPRTATTATSASTANAAADIAIRPPSRAAAQETKRAASTPIVAPARIAVASVTRAAPIPERPATARARANVAREKVAEAFSSATASADSLRKITRAACKRRAAAPLRINAASAEDPAAAACSVTKARAAIRPVSPARATDSAATARARTARAIDLTEILPKAYLMKHCG
jgi:hypothetical protein